VVPSQLHPNNWAMVRAFEILCLFFNIQPIVPVFLFFFQMKLTSKIDWVLLKNMSKKLFEFDSNIFRRFKDRFFKVVVNGLPLMFNKDGESHFPFYWQFNPTRLKSFDEDLLTLVERFDKAILEQLSVSLDSQAILSLSSVNVPMLPWTVKCLTLSFFVFEVGVGQN